MTRYAANTDVPVERTRAEIETIVRRYGADGYLSGWEARRAIVQFRCAGRYVRFLLKLPEREIAGDRVKRGARTIALKQSDVDRRWEQACRQRWRALALMIKAKLEAVESGIVSFEQEFLPHVVMPDGGTVYEHVRDKVAIAYEQGDMPPLLPDFSKRG